MCKAKTAGKAAKTTVVAALAIWEKARIYALGWFTFVKKQNFCEISFRHFNFCVPIGFKTSEEKFHAYTTSFDTAASILKFQKSNALILM